MSDLNHVVINGRLVKSAELSRWTDGTPYCNFTIGNNETYKNQNGEYESIGSFFDCTLKGSFAESMSKHLLKGRQVEVEGRLKQNRWETDGQKYSRIVIKVESIHLLWNPNTDKNAAGNSSSYNEVPQQNYQQPINENPQNEDFIPFNETQISEDIPF